MIAFISVRYIEPDPSTYEGMDLKIGKGEPLLINTGDPTVDFLTARAVADKILGPGAPFMGLSSVDHFEYDGGTINYGDPTQEQINQAKANAEQYGEDA